MRIKFTTPIAGSNFSHAPGDEVDWPDAAEARRFIQSGQAVAVSGGAGPAVVDKRADRGKGGSGKGGPAK